MKTREQRRRAYQRKLEKQTADTLAELERRAADQQRSKRAAKFLRDHPRTK